MISVTVKGTSISASLKSETEAMRRRLARVPRRTCQQAIGPRWARGTRSRRIASRMTTRDEGTNRAVISVDSSIGFNPIWEEEDTRPHIIRPRADRGQASVIATRRARGTVKQGNAHLAFEIGGKLIFAKEVRHPGTKGSHALRRAVRESEADFRRFITEAIRGE